MKVTLEVDVEQVDQIMIQELKYQYESMKLDLRKRMDSNHNEASEDPLVCGIFENDKEADCVEIQKHMDAFAKVLSYNMVHQEFEAWQNAHG